VEVRATTPADVPTVRELFTEYATGLGIDLAFQAFDEERAQLPGRYAPPTGRLLLAWDGESVAGCIALRELDDHRCEMKRLYVRPAYRGTGLGRVLAVRAIEEATAIGYAGVYLDTLPSMAAAIELYKSLGFVPSERYCHNPVPGELFLYKPLRSE
jgi:ribosomal protein S18 acetylase RimI-like enzyme